MRLDTLQARLAKSLDSANTRKENATPRPKPATRTAPRPAPRPQKGGGYLRLCISLTPADQERIDAICSYLAAKGERVTTSRAVKLALRTAPLSADLAAALASVKAEDGRARGK